MNSFATSIFCNMGSIILGILSWILAILAIRYSHARRRTCSFLSFSLCSLSLLLQFIELRNRVLAEDLAAVIDTSGAVLFAAAVLVFVCIILNLAALLRNNK